MRVLHVHGGNLFGGVETLLATIARNQLGLGMESEFALCFDGRLAAELRTSGISPRFVGVARFRRPLSVVCARKRLDRILREGRFDAVICHMPWAHALFGQVVRAARVPLLFWMHDAATGRHWLERLAAVTPPDYVICNSKYTCSTADNLYPRVRHGVCYPPVESKQTRLDPAERLAMRRELDTAADAVVIVQASRIESWKGHTTLLEALRLLRDMRRWTCWIAGAPQRKEEQHHMRELRNLALRLNISARVRFLGDRSDVSRVLGAADIYCQPNSSAEPFGIALVEALAAGLPVVTTALGGPREIIDGSCGITVAPGDRVALSEHLHALIENEGERRRLGANGPRRAVLLCDPRRQLERLRSIVETVAAGRIGFAVGAARPKAIRAPRVIHVAPVLFGDAIGGAERYTVELARAMAKRVPTMLLAFGAKPRRERIGELEVRIMRNWIGFRRFRFDPINPLMLRALISADIIHCHQPETMIASFALLYAHAANKPIFSSHLGAAGYGIHRLLDVTRWYDGHLHISEFSRRHFGHQTLPHARVVMGGVDHQRFRPDPLIERTGEILYVGRLLPHKGIDYLIEAVDKDTPLTIIGRPFRHAQQFFEDLRRLAQGKHVHFVLDADDDAITRAYQRASCVVLPSVHQTRCGEYHPIPELLGQTLIEAMSCGTPTICTDVASLPEVVEDGVTGWVVPPNNVAALGERIRYLRANPQEAACMGAAARRRALERFTWDAVVDRCLEAYGVGHKFADRAASVFPHAGR